MDPLRVLVVDDNPDAANSLATLIRLMGYESRAGIGSRDALQCLADGFEPHIYFVDLAMPRMEGIGFVRSVRLIGSKVRPEIYILTGHSDPSCRAACEQLDIDG